MKLIKNKHYLMVILGLVLCDCLLGGSIGIWREYYWSAVESKHLQAWISLTSIFASIALISCWISGYSSYLINIVSLNWRTKLTKKALISRTYRKTEGGAQRVQEDCFSYPSLLLGLTFNGVRSIIMLIVFMGIVIHQLGLIWCLFPVLYSLIGTCLAGKIAIPLINLNYINQVVEAGFRKHLERPTTLGKIPYYTKKYKEVHRNNFKLFKQTKYLNYFQSFFNQITVIVPHLMLAVIYFTSKLTFGVFMQVTASVAEIINNMSFILNSFSDINRFLSCRKRLKELDVI